MGTSGALINLFIPLYCGYVLGKAAAGFVPAKKAPSQHLLINKCG